MFVCSFRTLLDTKNYQSYVYIFQYASVCLAVFRVLSTNLRSMTTLTTARDRYNAANSLLCLLQALEGRTAVIELQNEVAVKGHIVQVDGYLP